MNKQIQCYFNCLVMSHLFNVCWTQGDTVNDQYVVGKMVIFKKQTNSERVNLHLFNILVYCFMSRGINSAILPTKKMKREYKPHLHHNKQPNIKNYLHEYRSSYPYKSFPFSEKNSKNQNLQSDKSVFCIVL